MRSRRTERVGKSPKQLLTGQAHPHWLELLGFERVAPAGPAPKGALLTLLKSPDRLARPPNTAVRSRSLLLPENSRN
jgi:hypothetical protein